MVGVMLPWESLGWNFFPRSAGKHGCIDVYQPCFRIFKAPVSHVCGYVSNTDHSGTSFKGTRRDSAIVFAAVSRRAPKALSVLLTHTIPKEPFQGEPVDKGLGVLLYHRKVFIGEKGCPQQQQRSLSYTFPIAPLVVFSNMSKNSDMFELS